MTKHLREIIVAAVDALGPGFPPLAPDARERVTSDVAGFLVQQIGGIPDPLRLPYHAALVVFDAAAVLHHQRTFRGLDRAARVAHLAWWANVGGLATRTFVKLLRSCTLLAWFDHPLVTERLAAAPRAGAAA